MMTYEIKKNPQYNSNEVYFSDKPPAEVRDALKVLKMRWNPVKACWYGFADESAIIAALCADVAPENDQPAGILSDGYMGATAWTGTKSHRHLYGADLSAAIRQELKNAGIKGVSVRCKTYSGGQSLTVTLKTTAANYIPESEFVASYQIAPSCGWIYVGKHEQPVFHERFWAMSSEERENVRQAAARYDYYKQTSTRESEYYCHNQLTAATNETRETIAKIEEIILAYHHDDSNGMVDYFDTNFYYDIACKSNIEYEEVSA